jgi:glycosyltransferase involved in cell wall biosynthesis
LVKKVLILAEFSEKGGTKTFLEKLIKYNHELSCVTKILIENYHEISSIKNTCKKFNAKYCYIPTRTKIFYNPYFAIVYDLYVYLYYIKKENYNLLFISNSSPWMFLILNIIEKNTIYFAHSYPNQYLSSFYFLIKLIPKFFSQSSNIVTVSRFSKRQFIKYLGVKPSIISVIHNSSIQPSIKKLNYNSTIDKVVLTVGRLSNEKNPLIWLDVAESLSKIEPNVQFIWVGADSYEKESIMKIIDKKELGQKVKIIEYVDDPSFYYRLASVYFQPSLMESHGIAVIDAMSYGIPCVVSKIGGLTESVTNEETGFLLEPDDVNGFVKKLQTILSDSILYHYLGKNGKTAVAKLFSENIQKQKIFNIYKNY